MATITLREHEYLNIGNPNKFDVCISEKQADTLKKLENSLPPNILTWHHKKVKFSQYCGIIYLGGDTIEVLPKIFDVDSSPESDRQILIKMLYLTQHLIPKSYGQADVKLQKHHLLDVFLNQFCDLLFEQIHQGIIKVYKTREDNLSVLRGRILLYEHIKSNIVHQEKIYCSYDELQEDNEYNCVIKATLRVLYKIAKNSRLRQRLTELLFIFSEVSDEDVTLKTIQNLPKNRMVSRYDQVFRMCEWFFKGYCPDVSVGKEPSLSLLFDMNKLFESFIARILKKAARREELTLREQGPQKYVAQDAITTKNVFLLKPDITLLDSNGTPKIILDMKWKLLDSEDSKKGVSQPDIYQMLAYAQRYRCNDCVLIYPYSKNIGDIKTVFRTNEGDIDIAIWNINLSRLSTGNSDTIQAQLSAKLSELVNKQVA